MKIHIFGASGSGVSTLGNALSHELNYPYFDTDDFYWLKTDPPFNIKRNVEERNSLLERSLHRLNNWVLGGSLYGWGNFLIDSFDLVVFLYVPKEIRVERLKKRELERYGTIILEDKERNIKYIEFLEWAAGYEDGTYPGRNLKGHISWLEKLPCKVLKIESEITIGQGVELIKTKLTGLVKSS